MNPVLAIAGVELRRFFRDRSNIFFVFIFPLMLILLLGIQFGVGSAGPIVAVAGGEGTPGPRPHGPSQGRRPHRPAGHGVRGSPRRKPRQHRRRTFHQRAGRESL